MSANYDAGVRENSPIYLIRQAEELLKISIEFEGSNEIFYACLDLRIALEILDLNTILTSVGDDDRIILKEESKPKNGIDRIGRKKGVLKEKYQMFFESVCEIVGVKGKLYDFKKSKDLQYQLSSYIHSYYLTDDDLKYSSPIMEDARNLIVEVITFVNKSLNFTDNTAYLVGIEISTLPIEDKLVLDEWKNSSIEYETLKNRLKENVEQRRQHE